MDLISHRKKEGTFTTCPIILGDILSSKIVHYYSSCKINHGIQTTPTINVHAQI